MTGAFVEKSASLHDTYKTPCSSSMPYYATPISPDCANPSNSRQETSDNNTSLDLLLGLLNKFFLGASLGGCVHKDRLVGSWRLPVKRARYWLVGGEHITLSGWSFSKRPELYQTIGNCAETYPIVHLLRGLNMTNGNVHGLALRKKAVREPRPNDLSARVNLVIDEELGFVVINGIVPGKVYPYYGNISTFTPDSMTAN
ncbi:hypothetical protein DTO039G3_1614 [Penicillium roqueforti]|nr:hypothetical protein CBS147318_31 [Penicillium roqueforti]KAI3178255.1 hypothetical protein DTO039G3_1614 [Penicillium roqueforti]KAI3300439.1 hypothetical protein DTO002I6_1162 [Penicillium roqueforti]